MNRFEAIECLNKEIKNDDTEVAHRTADDILCEFLESLGYSDVVTKYADVNKWYA